MDVKLSTCFFYVFFFFKSKATCVKRQVDTLSDLTVDSAHLAFNVRR